MRIGIFGTGGLGGFMGAKLAADGHEVVFIARGKHLEAMRRDGLYVDSIQGDFHLPHVNATDTPSEAGPCDAVIVTVKGWQVTDVAKQLSPMLKKDAVVVPLLNGVEASAQIAAVIGAQHTAGGLAKILAFIDGPGRIKHLGVEPYIGMGELDNRKSPRLEALRDALLKAGVTAEVVPDIHVALWDKFLFVVGWGGVGAVTRAPVGVLRELPQTQALLRQSMTEIAMLGKARGVDLPADRVEKSLGFLSTLPPEGTTSMQRDIMEGKRSELESWNGAVVRLAKETGVAVPLHEFVYSSLLPQEQAARGKG